MSDLGEEFAKICIQWLKKAFAWLVYAFWLHIRPSFPHLETLKKILENSTLSRYVKKKKKKKSRPTDPIFKFWSGEGNITIFFFGLKLKLQSHDTLYIWWIKVLE